MDVQGYDKYMIYEDGKIWSKWGKGKFLKPSDNGQGYLFVGLFNEDGIKKKMRIHRLVALHYILNPENKPEVDHIDRDTLNNHIGTYETAEEASEAYNNYIISS